MSEFKPRAFVKTTCPFSFKFRLFVTEAGLSDQFEFVPMDPFSDDFSAVKADIEAKYGKPVIFPVVEVEPGKFMSDSDALITHYASKFGVDDKALPTLNFYRNGLFPTIMELEDLSSGPLQWLIRLGRVPRAFR